LHSELPHNDPAIELPARACSTDMQKRLASCMIRARGDKPTISKVLAEYLRAEKGRLSPKTHARYIEVIALFTHSLNGYAANSLSPFERARFDKLFNAEGKQHREFCDFSAPSIFWRMSVSF
jgi:hypothetical protein